MSTPSSLSEAKRLSVSGRFAIALTGRTPRRWLWLGWLALAFGVLNIYGPPVESFRTKSDPPSVSTDILSRRTSVRDRILIDLRDDYNARFYYSIAQAALGRPYQPRYVPSYDGAGHGAWQGAAAGIDDGETVAPPRPLRPWRDFQLEYPPGMLAVILAPSFVTTDRDTYFTIFSLEMELFLTLAVYLSVRTADLLRADGTRVLFQAILLTAALGVVAVRRYDPSVALAISATVYALAARRPGLSGAALALGVALKGVPLLLAPVIALWFVARRDWTGLRMALSSFAICMGVATIGYLAIAWPRVFVSFAYHANRPIQMESIYSAFLMFVRWLSPQVMTIKYSYGSYSVISTYEPLLRTISNIATLLGLLAAYLWAYRHIHTARDDREKFIAMIFASCACLVAFISLGKVSNSQYLVWLIPLGALAGALSAGDGRWRLVIACALAQAVYPFLYTIIIPGRLAPIDGLIILARDVSLWRWLFRLTSDPIAGSRGSPSTTEASWTRDAGVGPVAAA
jgi:Glycosyltransferase family 87